ncbi:MAG: hypothetical protein CME70_03345 [Halobacteriovorax sp.]|nr:hypothetical protein [Halobacteriovorax sp.]MBK23019.1 hypothetical protein [Halobacteriovorax sp.]|tara:strand:- start:54846 stop:55247 length:402 start_codon:yes stop_codon:yes gene_type:complete
MNYLKNNERRVDESTFNRLSQLSGLNECIGFLLENRGAHDPESLVENCRAITHYSVTAMEYASRALIGIGDVTQKRVDELMTETKARVLKLDSREVILLKATGYEMEMFLPRPNKLLLVKDAKTPLWSSEPRA